MRRKSRTDTSFFLQLCARFARVFDRRTLTATHARLVRFFFRIRRRTPSLRAALLKIVEPRTPLRRRLAALPGLARRMGRRTATSTRGLRVPLGFGIVAKLDLERIPGYVFTPLDAYRRQAIAFLLIIASILTSFAL